MTDKEVFASRIRNLANQLGSLQNQLAEMGELYFDRGYDGVGSDPIIDADVSSQEIDAATIASMMTCVAQMNNFFGNSAVTTGDYGATINQTRKML